MTLHNRSLKVSRRRQHNIITIIGSCLDLPSESVTLNFPERLKHLEPWVTERMKDRGATVPGGSCRKGLSLNSPHPLTAGKFRNS